MRTRMSTGGVLLFWCPGCEGYHGVHTDKSHRNPVTNAVWEWNGSFDMPTLSPSVLVFPHETLKQVPPDGASGDELMRFCDENRVMTPRCHSFVRDGRIEFLSDCTHALAGQTVEMEHDE